ncbi:MAG: hypothetical protein CVV30_00060 [Methanomicrobiales archaeon HGW-Methanomicrobiales-1]|nr:MAG: hypothetical protein CVV30_00060 [Methanomicrobiales archaeon HGW-Methanomicrobiales-1]
MTHRIVPVSFVIVLLLLLVSPVAATMALTDVSYTPNPPLVTGGQQHVTAMYYIGPSGSTTFIKGHELQMQTELLNARWDIQVIQNGRNAAQQSASGSTAFVNGEILSYPNNNDISLSITIDGVVPQAQAGQVMVLQVEELDTAGNVVPGSVITLSQPVAGEPGTSVPTVLPTLTPPPIPPNPTKSAGFTLTAGIIASGLALLVIVRRDE